MWPERPCGHGSMGVGGSPSPPDREQVRAESLSAALRQLVRWGRGLRREARTEQTRNPSSWTRADGLDRWGGAGKGRGWCRESASALKGTSM